MKRIINLRNHNQKMKSINEVDEKRNLKRKKKGILKAIIEENKVMKMIEVIEENKIKMKANM